ncbi:MAG: hypothetical protein Kow0075_08340 [Salibacteraceae bacterium]
MFPLDTLLLPGEQLPLHIFEPRYRKLFKALEEGEFIQFGIPYKRGEHPPLVSVCRLVRVAKRFRGGLMNVIVECDHLALQLGKIMTDGDLPFPKGNIGEALKPVGETKPPVELMSKFADYIAYKFGTRPGYAVLHKYSIADVAACLNLSNDDKLKYLQLATDADRERFLNGKIDYLLLLFQQEAKTDNGLIMN